jgi:hypothetical protein
MASLIKENEIFKSQSNVNSLSSFIVQPSKNFKALNEFLLNANKQNQPKFDLKQSQEKFNHFTTNDMKTLVILFFSN